MAIIGILWRRGAMGCFFVTYVSYVSYVSYESYESYNVGVGGGLKEKAVVSRQPIIL